MNPLLEALFAADHIAGTGGMLSIQSPGAPDKKVSTLDLANKLLAYGFLCAKEQGALDLAVGIKKVLFVKSTFVEVKRGSTPAQFDSPLLAGLIQNVVDGKTVYDAIYTWFGEDVDNPYAGVVQGAVDEALRAGYLQMAQQKLLGAIASACGGVARTEPVPAKADEIASIRDAGIKRWDAWNASDKNLVHEVVLQCSKALGARKTQDTSAIDNLSAD